MQRQNERRVFRNHQIRRADTNAEFFEPVDFLDKGPGIDDNTVADNAKLARTHHPGRQKRQFVSDTINYQRVASIVAALKANDHIGARRQPVDDLAFALVTPLRANYRYIGHFDFRGKLPPTNTVSTAIQLRRG